MKTKRWTEERGFEIVRQWERSGLSMAAFARGRGYDAQRLRYWRERVQVEPKPLARAVTKLVRGLVVNTGAAGGVRLVLPRGVVIEAGSVREISAAWVAEVVRALETSP